MMTQKQAYALGRQDKDDSGGDVPARPDSFHASEAHRLAYLDGFQGFAFHPRKADGTIPRRKKTLLPGSRTT